MSRTLDRHRLYARYAHGLDAISGDAETTKMVSDLLSEAAQRGGKYLSEKQAKEEAAQKGTKAKAGSTGEAKPSAPSKPMGGGGRPTWQYVAAGVGGLVVLALGVKLLKGKRSAVRRAHGSRR